MFLVCPACSAWTRRETWTEPVRFTIACPECGQPCDVGVPEVRILPPGPPALEADTTG